MTTNNNIISMLILILVTGLLYNLSNINNKINDSFKTYECLSELKAKNNHIDSCVNNIGSKNYDEVNKYILDIDKIILKMKITISENSIEDKYILNTFKKLQNSFILKNQNIQQCKTLNSIVNNTYKNFLQLSEVLKEQLNKEEKKVLDGIIIELLTKHKINQIKQLTYLVQNKSNYKMDLLYKNIIVYQKTITKIKNLQQNIKNQDLLKTINNFTALYTKYNHTVISKSKIIIVLFVFVLLIILGLNYILTKRIAKSNYLLEDQAEKLKASLNLVDENVIISQTDLYGVITSASEAFSIMSEYSKEELIGSPHNIVRHPDITKEIFENMWQTIKKDQIWKGEVKNLKKYGGYYWVNASISPLFKDGIKIGYTSVRENITDKKKIEELNNSLETRIKQEVEKNRQKDQQIIQQARLAQMGEMISMIAHQWRQPLTAISSTCNAINLKAKLNKLDIKQTVELSNKIISYSAHLSTTIDDFREFFKPNKEKKDTTYSEIINSVLGIIEISIENKNITIIKNLNSNIVFYTYANELKQVILNLVKNAEDALIGNADKNSYIKIDTTDNVLIISDNGGGVPNDILDKIFDPYFSTKKELNGTGLGLYMSKTIIEEHCNGKLSVSNDKDGAVFKIILQKKEMEKNV